MAQVFTPSTVQPIYGSSSPPIRSDGPFKLSKGFDLIRERRPFASATSERGWVDDTWHIYNIYTAEKQRHACKAPHDHGQSVSEAASSRAQKEKEKEREERERESSDISLSPFFITLHLYIHVCLLAAEIVSRTANRIDGCMIRSPLFGRSMYANRSGAGWMDGHKELRDSSKYIYIFSFELQIDLCVYARRSSMSYTVFALYMYFCLTRKIQCHYSSFEGSIVAT